MKVIFKHRMGGREQTMDVRYAEILQKLGRGTYMTRDMQAQSDAADPQYVIDKKPAKKPAKKITKAVK